MHTPYQHNLLAQFLRLHPHALSARINGPSTNAKIIATYDATVHTAGKPNANPFQGTPVEWEPGPVFKTLLLPLHEAGPQSKFTACQNEPVKLGTQIQPGNKNWVGTAGAPVHWQSAAGVDHYGFLTNWHVMPGGELPQQHPAYQPTAAFGPLGRLIDWSSVDPNQDNRVDAAVCDALMDGFHTITDEILETGNLDPNPQRAMPGMNAMKVGRTTGFTRGQCIQTGVAVRVGYGDFVALFVDQDVYRTPGGQFSAAGDSGSLITCEASNCPLSLLFAGGGDLTIGNPMRHVVDTLSIDFLFP